MKKKYNGMFFALLSLALIGLVFFEQAVYAEGGQVTTNGVVGFYEESSSEPIKSSSSSEPIIQKPKGKLPSTGEIVNSPFTWIGIVLAVSVIGLFLWRKNRQRNKGDN